MKRLVLVVLLAGCSEMAARAVPAPTVTTGPLSWKVSQTEHSFAATAKAPIQISDTARAYMLLYRVHWERKLDPAAPPETTLAAAVVVPGVPGRHVELSDYRTRCTEYTVIECIRKAAEPAARIELVGWTRFERP